MPAANGALPGVTEPPVVLVWLAVVVVPPIVLAATFTVAVADSFVGSVSLARVSVSGSVATVGIVATEAACAANVMVTSAPAGNSKPLQLKLDGLVVVSHEQDAPLRTIGE